MRVMKTRIAIIYYSSTGNVSALARALAEGVEDAGGEARLRKVRELAPEVAIAKNPAWLAHHRATAAVPEATLDDLAWADGYAFGTPSRFGGAASQLRAFLDTVGGLWASGALADKPATAFTSAGNDHGGQEATLLGLHTMFCHWGSILVPPGFTDPRVYGAGGNPYGVSVTDTGGAALPQAIADAARHQGERLATFAALVRPKRLSAAA